MKAITSWPVYETSDMLTIYDLILLYNTFIIELKRSCIAIKSQLKPFQHSDN